jgi:hypothetical protein
MELREPPRRRLAPLDVGYNDLPSEMRYAVMEVDRCLNAGMFRPAPRYINSIMSEVYALPAVVDLEDDETAHVIALMTDSGVVAVGGKRLPDVECVPVSLAVQLKGGLLMVTGHRSFDDLSPAVKRHLRSMKGKFIRPPIAAPHDAAYQSWHNGRVLKRLHWLPEVAELIEGRSLSVRVLVDLENGLIESLAVDGELIRDAAEEYGEVMLEVSRKVDDLFIRWSETSALANLEPRLRRCFGGEGAVFMPQPRIMPQSQPQLNRAQAIITQKMPSFMAGR